MKAMQAAEIASKTIKNSPKSNKKQNLKGNSQGKGKGGVVSNKWGVIDMSKIKRADRERGKVKGKQTVNYGIGQYLRRDNPTANESSNPEMPERSCQSIGKAECDKLTSLPEENWNNF